MRLYVTGKTGLPQENFYLDIIECGDMALYWDETDFTVRDGRFDVRLKGIYYFDDDDNEIYLNGKIDEIIDKQFRVLTCGQDEEIDPGLEIHSIAIDDGDRFEYVDENNIGVLED